MRRFKNNNPLNLNGDPSRKDVIEKKPAHHKNHKRLLNGAKARKKRKRKSN